jgi:hypothetical protein
MIWQWIGILLGVAACTAVPAFCVWLPYRAAVRATMEVRFGGRKTMPGLGPESIPRCSARLVFASRQLLSLVLDAVVEECGGSTVPPGTPFSLRVAVPASARRVASQLEAFAREERLLVLKLVGAATGPSVRLQAGDVAMVLRLEDATGWPVPALS